MKNELFDIESLKLIRNKLDYIYSTAKNNYNDNPELMDTIENLSKVASMFATIKMQEIEGIITTSSPQGYIVANLATSFSRMKTYEKQKENDFPAWKL
jgi:hypothetical protein